eukprot:scaffold55100_cov69-Phaeocystis_antarctica.AAC.1
MSSRPCAPKLSSTLAARCGVCAVSMAWSPNVNTGIWNDGSCASCRFSTVIRRPHWSAWAICVRTCCMWT